MEARYSGITNGPDIVFQTLEGTLIESIVGRIILRTLSSIQFGRHPVSLKMCMAEFGTLSMRAAASSTKEKCCKERNCDETDENEKPLF